MFKKSLLALTSIFVLTTIPNISQQLETKIATNNTTISNNNFLTPTTIPITRDINFNDQRAITVGSSQAHWGTYYSEDKLLLASWNEYASNWNAFLAKYPTISLTNGSIFKMSAADTEESITNFQRPTSKIKAKSDTHNILYYLYFTKTVRWQSHFSLIIMESWIKIWHDNNNIYWNYVFKINSGTTFN